MARTMSASGMTKDQIRDIGKKVCEAARKHRENISQTAAQKALSAKNVGMLMFAAFRQLADTMSNLVVRRVKVNRQRSPQEALDACGRVQYVNKDVVAAMPRGKGKNVGLMYFKLHRSEYKGDYPTCAELAEGYRKRALVADPQAQIDDNAANPEFADKTPNACQWIDADGKYCYATFYRWDVERSVRVNRDDIAWRDYWSFAGVPQGASA